MFYVTKYMYMLQVLGIRTSRLDISKLANLSAKKQLIGILKHLPRIYLILG